MGSRWLWVVWLLVVWLEKSYPFGVKFEEGAYRRVSVHISGVSEPANCGNFLTKLEELINETSFHIWEFTAERVRIGDVQVVLPSSWSLSKCRAGRKIKTGHVTRNADVIISSPHPGLGLSPWTIQPLGCGKPGSHISIPWEFVAEASGDLSGNALIVMREWVKYRYGVFEEVRGFSNDPIYKDRYRIGSETVQSYGCSRSNATSPLQYCRYQRCEDMIAKSSSSEQPIFCDAGDNLDMLAPTKQNLLCNGQTAREIVFSHPDLLERFGEKSDNLLSISNKSFPLAPSFTYLVAGPSHYSLVLDQTSTMKIWWEQIRKSLFRFIQNLPNGTTLSIITFGMQARLTLPPTVITNTNREDLCSRIPRRATNENFGCLKCSLDLAVDTLSDYKGSTQPGSVILLTGDQPQSLKLGNILQTVEEVPLQGFVISFSQLQVPPELYQFAEHGQVYGVSEEHVGQSLSVYISEVLLGVRNMVETIQSMKVHQHIYFQSEVEATFNVEYGLQSDLMVMLAIDDEMKVEQFEVIDPAGNKNIFSHFESGLVYFKFSNVSGTGVWTYHVKLYENAKFPEMGFSVDVTATVNSEDAVIVTAYNNFQHEIVDQSSLPVVIYAKVERRNDAVMSAKVIADISGPAGSLEHVVLQDSGSGYPDITAQDGIYSAYLTHIAIKPGTYNVRLFVSDDSGMAVAPKRKGLRKNYSSRICCGSSMDVQETVPTGYFSRILSGPSFFVSFGTANDTAPPSRITDVSILNDGFGGTFNSSNSMEVTLGWTAPGGDFQNGKASRYEIRTATKVENLRGPDYQQKGILVHPSLTPSPAVFGSAEKCNVGVPWPNEIFYYAVVAIDEQGNRGDISNLVAVYIHEDITTTTTSTSTTTTTTTSTTTTITSTVASFYNSIRRMGIEEIDDTSFISSTQTQITYTSPTPTMFLPTKIGLSRRNRKQSRHSSTSLPQHRLPRLQDSTITPSRGFLRIRDLFESDLFVEGSEIVYHNSVDKEPRENLKESRRERNDDIKDEVYAATGVGGGLLVLTLLMSLIIISRYRRKLLEGRDSTTFRHNSIDFGPSFQHNSEEDNNSINKIYSLIKPQLGIEKDKKMELNKAWLNPMAKLESEVGSQVSHPTNSTVDISEFGEFEDRVRSAGDEIDVLQNPIINSRASSVMVDVDKYVKERSPVSGGGVVDMTNMDNALWAVPDAELGKLLLEVYSGGTFKKSMNYHSFRDTDKRNSKEINIECLDSDSLEISGSQLTVLPSSETSRRSRLSDLFPDILNFKSMSPLEEREIPSPDYPNSPEKSLSIISENDKSIGNGSISEKPLKQTQYYFGQHSSLVSSQSSNQPQEAKMPQPVEKPLLFDLRSAISSPSVTSYAPPPSPPGTGLTSLDVPQPMLPGGQQAISRGYLRQLYDVPQPCSSTSTYDRPRKGPPLPIKVNKRQQTRKI